MRILHTSDWHLGRTFHGRDLLGDQRDVLAGLAELVRAEGVDVVVIAGDLYDRAVPSGEAVGVCHHVLAALRDAGATIVLTPGNHDSAPRLGAYADFAAAGGLHLRTRISGLDAPVVLDDEHGAVAFYGIPYLDPDPARHSMELDGRRIEAGHTGVLTEAMRRITADLSARGPGVRSVVLAHAFVTGGQGSESERKIAIGGVEQVPASVFAGIDYVALGHLHGPQTLRPELRYSGSPLAYSFSERAHRKSVWLVDLDADGLGEVRRHELPVPRRLAMLTGRLDDLLADPEHEALAECYLSVTLTDRVRPLEPMRRLQERFPHAVHLDWQPAGGLVNAGLHYSEAVRGKNDRELAASFVADCRGAQPDEVELRLLDDAFNSVGGEQVRS
ncbi:MULTISPECIES: exonuclease SbcCD subunit D [Actinoalloteichus]|uniref:Nuclease SbcCD subunit D n=1 Tax=Actinoalloteichus fjordicus TaxID=1612552 RepID=A0AAC9L7P0_9PSEU|nr:MULTISPECIES: exonuclease SbcCD subunit D [Actinoalloteichus]APU12918.1 Exodeoxyribonuclease I subunit D [Actinoalloteichus fjordicus]APU18890.1 Exodeoxyribonuclease I subunit D [Actinoalloteichus sp. GBA129-24]